jgi:hypothetical protein
LPLPRIGVVFRLWQCDKENQDWREGPPLTVLCQSSDLPDRPSPSGKITSDEKRILLSDARREPSLKTLAGFFAHLAHLICTDEP